MATAAMTSRPRRRQAVIGDETDTLLGGLGQGAEPVMEETVDLGALQQQQTMRLAQGAGEGPQRATVLGGIGVGLAALAVVLGLAALVGVGLVYSSTQSAVAAAVAAAAAPYRYEQFSTPDDTLVMGDTTSAGNRYYRTEAECAASVRLSENPIDATSPGVAGLRHVVFDLAACNSGGFPHFPIFGLGGCGPNCPAGTFTLGTVYATSGVATPSDERVKENIQAYDSHSALRIVNAIHVKEYEHSDAYAESTDFPAGLRRPGFIAQQVDAVAPWLVRTVEQYRLEDGTTLDDFKMLRKEDMMPLAWAGIQELTRRVGDLEDAQLQEE